MLRSTRSLVASVSVAVCLWPAAVFAQGHETPFTVDQVQEAFSNAGYRTEQVHDWDWTSPPVTTFQVNDSASGRVVLVLVYRSTDGAEAARLQAVDRELALNGGPLVTDPGPHLVLGYGPSAWIGNVAMVQTTQTRLERLYQIQNDRDIGMSVDSDVMHDASLPSLGVDLEFQRALNNVVVNV